MVDLSWPSDLGGGKVVWQLFLMGADNWDEDREPQLKAANQLIVDFEPDTDQAVRYEGEQGKASIMPMISRGIINEQGQLCTMAEERDENGNPMPGPVGVILPATDSETITPRKWSYRATITENRVRIREFSFYVLSDETTNLADFLEVDPDGGTHIVTEVETAERAEKARDDAEKFRDTTRGYRNETESFRDEARTARSGAESAATDAGQSATSAASVLDSVQALGITVDESVGTRVFVGDTMIYGDTGWRDITDDYPNTILPNSIPGSGVFIRRVNDLVSINFAATTFVDGFSGRKNIIPNGFRSNAYQYFWRYPDGDFRMNVNRIYEIRGTQSEMRASAIYNATDPWPTSLPGTSA